MKSTLRYLSATVVGAFLFVAPFAWYGAGAVHAHGAAGHMDHGPRHGGHLLMVRGHHVELVEQRGQVELYLSDGSRRPVRPRSCAVTLPGGERASCRWESYRLVVSHSGAFAHAHYELEAKGAEVLRFKFP
ncbi:MAG: hypothetical protein AAF500_16655 [Myxococcota bacterium]